MRRAISVLAVMLSVACGQPPQLASRSTASAAPSASPGPADNAPPPSGTTASSTRTSIPVRPPATSLVYAVIEGATLAGGQPNTIAIVGMDGYAKAKASFQPRNLPRECGVAIPMQGVAEVRGQGVYYMDGNGTVRVIRAGSQPQVAATFSQAADQGETWFAVSPNGSQVMAGVYTWPTIGPAQPGSYCPWSYIGGPSFSLELAGAGTTRELVHSSAANSTDQLKPIFPVGWTSDGPIAMIPVSLGTQNAWWGGPLYVVDSSGKLPKQVGGGDCNSASILPSGLIACTSGQYVVTVRDSAGTVIWTTQVDGFNALTLFLSPDGQAVSDGRKVESHTLGLISMPAGFNVEGWLDTNTVIGRQVIGNGPDQGNLSWISLGDPSTIHDLGFKGDFVGTLGT